MSDCRPLCVVLTGLIGAGKTALAHQLRDNCGYRYIDFDASWHDEIGNKIKEGVRGTEHFMQAVDQIALSVIMAAAMPVVIDGWFTWLKDSWEQDQDTTLQRLTDLVKGSHRVRVWSIWMQPEDAGCAIVAKRSHVSDRDRRTYESECFERQMSIARKVGKWVKS